MKKLIILLIPLFLVTGCQTEATQKRFTQAQSDTLTCQQKVMEYRQKIATAQSQAAAKFSDPKDYMLLVAITTLANANQSNELGACDDAYIAMIKADSLKLSKILDGSFGLAKFGIGGLIAVDIADSIVDGMSNGGDTFNMRDITATNNAGAAGEFQPGGDAALNFNLGGNQNTLTDGSSFVSAEKLQQNQGQSGDPDFDDSLDGSGNDAGILQ